LANHFWYVFAVQMVSFRTRSGDIRVGRGFLHARNTRADRGNRRYRGRQLPREQEDRPLAVRQARISGNGPNAAPPKAAEARIEKIRKGNLTVIVKDNLFRGDEKRNEMAQWTRVASRRRGAYGLWLSFDVRIHVF
jgi:hypothetical protein